MRTPDRILIAAALGLMSGFAPAFGFDGTTRPPSDVVTPATPPGGMTPAAVNSRIIDLPPRPPGAIPRPGGVIPAVVPNASLPRPTAPVPSLANTAPPALDRPVPPPTAFAAPSIPIAPFEAFRFGTRAMRDGQKEKGLASLEYAAEQGVVQAQFKLGRMYADGDGVPRSDIKAFGYFSRIADNHADDNPGMPESSLVGRAFVSLGNYYSVGIADSDVKADPARARHMYGYAASYFGDADGQYHLGRMMLDPANPYYEPKQAARWLYSAANKGQYQAQALLGRMLFRGEAGLPRAPARGLMWLTLARANAAPSEGWIVESYDSALKLSTERERELAGDYLIHWRNGRRD